MSWSDDRAVDAVHWQILKNHLKPNVWPTSREMLKYKQELDTSRHADLNQLASSIQEMKKKLSYLKKTALDVNKIKTVGFEHFRNDIKTFESKLSKLKEGCSKKLREESVKQYALFEEIERVKQLALHDVVSKPHADAISKKKKETKTIKRVPISKNTYSSKEIADFHDFCARNYGLTGGWSSKDHETFLKIRSKYVDAVDFVDHIVQSMPHITEDAAREHENWFIKFEELKNKQKEAITKWKKEKKNVFVPDCNPNNCDMLRKCADNDPEITGKFSSDNYLEKQINVNHDINKSQIEFIESKKLDNCGTTLLKRFREKDKRYIDSKKTNKQRLECQRKSDPFTIVTLHGNSEKYDEIESLEKLPNVHLSIYGAHNQDVKVVLKYQ
ncbi:coiled-coil domain-containing protein 112-like isoform X2 [Metopolophium dirhodum]|uniref:coiled-coil domain-containing protein 112-like isoform X2 n=1 Tax=Metopolophium dirhodum TaxID=44670 RepID=UPI00299065E3|nr:coiled-coil domain-containing protein 112-like isoform X2 [Metopolophium dirhodum]